MALGRSVDAVEITYRKLNYENIRSNIRRRNERTDQRRAGRERQPARGHIRALSHARGLGRTRAIASREADQARRGRVEPVVVWFEDRVERQWEPV
jgi:hypothetical protein